MCTTDCFTTDVSLRPFHTSIDKFINWLIWRLINRWILMSDLWNRHGPSVDLCQSIGVSKYPLIYHSGDVSWCLLQYWCVPPSVLSVRFVCPLIDQLINRSINRVNLDVSWLEIDTAPSPSPPWFVSVKRGYLPLCWYISQVMRPNVFCRTDVSLYPFFPIWSNQMDWSN